MARVQRLIRIAVLVSAGVAVAGIAFVIVRVGWFDNEPSFRLEGEQTFTCYLDRALRYPTLSVGFSDNGKRAVIHFPDRDASTAFQRGGLTGDVFRDDGVELLLDPEAYVTGYGAQSIGPCQRD
ncbi:hypothetical protein NS365_09865 [Aureimonas ureilytica]|uniref:Uncharacterized protein n=1 Tax=Aureimonas ureilytica TaxID=401562 RepID=A0A175RPK4_9HYPH|nr:hypothetical protein [Aureimonas ureilytica]KTR05700.1 hypothetical protein NS365_09865 [Aureimonas ureilytica]